MAVPFTPSNCIRLGDRMAGVSNAPLVRFSLIELFVVVCRLRIQHEALVKEEREQTEFIEQLILQK